jgi:CBS-domain-containing membrane protein
VTRKLRDIMSPAPACLITVRVLAENRDPQTTLIGEICSHGVSALGPDDGADQADRLVHQRVVRRIPVLQDGIPVGVVAVGDLALCRDASVARPGARAASPDF